MRWLLIACGLAGCSVPNVHFTTDGGSDDAPSDATAPRCDPTAPFGAAQIVPGGNGGTVNTGARLSPDERTLYYSRDTASGYDIFVATRQSLTDPFTGGAVLAGVNTAEGEFGPTVTGDQLTIYVARPVMMSTSDYGVYTASRTSVSSSFGPPTLVASLDTPQSEGDPYVLPDHSALYFGRGLSGTVPFAIWRAARGGSGAFSAATTLDELSTVTNTLYPVVSPDERTIYFARAVAMGANTDYQMYVATRSSAAVQFSNITLLAELDTSEQEWPTWISNDGCVLYFSRGNQTVNNWFATRGP